MLLRPITESKIAMSSFHKINFIGSKKKLVEMGLTQQIDTKLIFFLSKNRLVVAGYLGQYP